MDSHLQVDRRRGWTLAALLLGTLATGPGTLGAADAVSQPVAPSVLEQGRRMYMEGVLPSGEVMDAFIQGDVRVTGQQAICGACHRRSGMGASEGGEVALAITGAILYQPLRTPTSKPPLPPERRPAYTDETLKRAIREGIDPAGRSLDPVMPRYRVSDADLDVLITYMKTLSARPSPGVDEEDIHFATIVTDGLPAETRRALLEVMQTFVEQKNVETRHETQRKQHAPWHKAWMLEPYRKWVLQVWDLKGPPTTWRDQLEAYYAERPVFAVVNGTAPGGWRPVHAFCEARQVPCLFPTTDLPVVDEWSFYALYLSPGMALEGRAVARHAGEAGAGTLVQVYRAGDERAAAAAAALRETAQEHGAQVADRVLEGAAPSAEWWEVVLRESQGRTLALWLSPSDLGGFWPRLGGAVQGPARVYLSTTLYDGDLGAVPPAARERTYFVHPYELPDALPGRLARSTGWLRAKGIYAPEEARVQANAYLALKTAGEALRVIRGYFFRDYFVERIEHMTENSPYTSVYPRISLASGQRFAAKGCYIARVRAGEGEPPELVAVTGWFVP